MDFDATAKLSSEIEQTCRRRAAPERPYTEATLALQSLSFDGVHQIDAVPDGGAQGG